MKSIKSVLNNCFHLIVIEDDSGDNSYSATIDTQETRRTKEFKNDINT
jgi:hypothetical protein